MRILSVCLAILFFFGSGLSTTDIFLASSFSKKEVYAPLAPFLDFPEENDHLTVTSAPDIIPPPFIVRKTLSKNNTENRKIIFIPHISVSRKLLSKTEEKKNPEETQISTAERAKQALFALAAKPEESLAAAAPSSDDLCGLSVFQTLSPADRKVVSDALKNIPCRFLQSLKKVEILDDMDTPRALSGAHSLYLRRDLFSLPEAKKVIIHEMGHVVDLGGLTAKNPKNISSFKDGSLPIWTDDMSVSFYVLSWADSHTRLPKSLDTDFVSGYAKSDIFEDFAESFLLYQENGIMFRELAKNSPVLAKKYNFFRQNIFSGREFQTGYMPKSISGRGWDATKM